jgi:hypothetical protein
MKGKKIKSKKSNSSTVSKAPRPEISIVNGALDWKETLKNLLEYIIVSIDPGETNIGFRIEKRVRLPHDPAHCTVETLELERLSIPYIWEGEQLTVFIEITRILDSYRHYYKYTCLYILEDQQVPDSYKVLRIAQHMETYFSIMSSFYPGSIVMSISPKMKTKYLNAPAKMERVERVKWQEMYGYTLLSDRKDNKAIAKFYDNINKGDDIMVAVIQVEAVFEKLGLPTCINRYLKNAEFAIR